jgi:hypothetical protein
LGVERDWSCSGTVGVGLKGTELYVLCIAKQNHSEKKGALQNPSKRFCRFPKVLKCVQNLKKRIKNSTEPFEGSVFYPTAEPSLAEPFFRFCTAKKGSVRKYGTLRVL